MPSPGPQNNQDPFEGFEGYEVPHYTQVPDQLFDEHLPHLGHAELKVLLFIIRRTFGWGKEADAISLSQLERGTGLSRRSVRDAVKSLEQKHLIVTDRYSTPHGDAGVNVYRLNIKHQNTPEPPASPVSADTPLSDKEQTDGKNLPGGRGISTPPQGTYSPTVGEKVPHPQYLDSNNKSLEETSLQQTLIQETSLSPPAEENSPLALAQAFFEALGQSRVSKKKRERAISIISQLLSEGFTPAEITAAIKLAAVRGARDAGILPYVIGEAVAALPSLPTQQLPSAEPHSPDHTHSAENTYEEILTRIHSLPRTMQDRLREAALRRIGNRTANPAVIEGIMIGLYQRGFLDQITNQSSQEQPP